MLVCDLLVCMALDSGSQQKALRQTPTRCAATVLMRVLAGLCLNESIGIERKGLLHVLPSLHGSAAKLAAAFGENAQTISLQLTQNQLFTVQHDVIHNDLSAVRIYLKHLS